MPRQYEPLGFSADPQPRVPMTVTDYQSFMAPVLGEFEDGEPCQVSELREHVAARVVPTEDDRAELVPSGQKPLYHDRISWAVTTTAAYAVKRVDLDYFSEE